MTDQNQFTRSLSGGYKMTNMAVVYTSLEGEAIKEIVVRESTETRSRVEDGDGDGERIL